MAIASKASSPILIMTRLGEDRGAPANTTESFRRIKVRTRVFLLLGGRASIVLLVKFTLPPVEGR
jgi:hypothetical protein